VIKLSILVPVWNQEELIIRALDSVPRRCDIEVLVCDDGSTDNTLKNVRAYAKAHKDLNIRVLYHKENKGLGFTKNKLYDNTKGEYVYELDSDDYLITEEFDKAMRWLDGTDLVFVNLRINDGRTLVLNENTKNTWVGGASKFIRREYLGNIRCNEVRVFEDVEVNKGLMSKPHTEKYTGLTVYRYNWPREGSLCWLGSRGLIK
jgi:glycosyltransferase involved in cell wall biosynthesis